MPGRNRKRNRSIGTVLAVAGPLVALVVALVDVLTGYEINLGLFYLVPIAMVTWSLGRTAGLVLAAACVVGMFIVDHRVTREIPFPTHDLVPYWNSLIRLGYFIVFVWILATLKKAHDRERQRARRDFLTGALNSQAFDAAVRDELACAQRSGFPLSMAYLDCDNFKYVNDQFGHGTGDEVLRATVAIMKRCLRDSDVIARLGGDEFAVLLGATGTEDARVAMEAVRAALVELSQQRGWPVTYSIGVVTFLAPPRNPQAAIAETDRLMYEVKKDGKDGIAVLELGGDSAGTGVVGQS